MSIIGSIYTQFDEEGPESGKEVNYEGSAVYVYNVSFNRIESEEENLEAASVVETAEVRVRIPAMFNYLVGDYTKPIESVEEEVDPITGDTDLTFKFKDVELGVAIRMVLAMEFKIGTPNGTEYQNEATLWIGDETEPTDTAITKVLRLVLVHNFQLNFEKLIPLTDPAPGGTVIVEGRLEDFGDKGAEILNTFIECPMPPGLTLDTGFEIIGKDKSQGDYVDTREDGRTAQIVGNGFTFTLDAYRGYDYRFMFRATIGPVEEVGEQIEILADWYIEGEAQNEGKGLLILDEQTYLLEASVYGPTYTEVDEYITHSIYITNSGNQMLQNVEMKADLAVEVKAYSFETGTFWIGEIEFDIAIPYTLTYTTIQGGSGTLGTFTTDTNQVIDLTTVITNPNDQLNALTWNFATLNVGVVQKVPPTFNGVIKDMGRAAFGDIFSFFWDTPEGRESIVRNKSVTINPTTILYPSFKRVGRNLPVAPGDQITYRMTINCDQSRVVNPIIAAILPEQLEYVRTDSIRYSSYFPEEEPFISPVEFEVTDDFKGLVGRQRILMRFSDQYAFKFRQREKLDITFTLQVKTGAKGIAQLGMVMSNIDNTVVVDEENAEYYEDMYGIVPETGIEDMTYALARETVQTQIMFAVIVASDKKVKGELDAEYQEVPNLGSTWEGGTVHYKLDITNIGNADLRSVEIVDILPHVDDTGVILTNQPRKSEFIIYNANDISATITPLREGQDEPVIKIQYSESYNPIRFGPKMNIIDGDNDWRDTIPQPETNLKSFKVLTENTILYPGQTLSIVVQCIVPTGTSVGKEAWNSFAANVSYIDLDEKVQQLLAVEPEKIGVRVDNTDPDKVQIGGIVFNDLNENNLYDVGEGVNDVVVMLYNEAGQFIRATDTVPNADGENGHYLFSNVEPGSYYIRVNFDELSEKFILQQVEEPNGSKVDSRGVSPLIVVDAGEARLDMYAGLVKLPPDERLKFIMEVNESANKMLRGATYNQLLIGMKLEDTIRLIDETK